MQRLNLFAILKIALFSILSVLLLVRCERDIELDLPAPQPKIVVEGSIETGQPPMVILNKNYPYFGTFSYANYQAGFVHDATVQISNGTQTQTLEEVCWSELSDAEKALFGQMLGSAALPDGFEFCVYTFKTLAPPMIGENGKTYTLYIETTDGKTATAVSKLPYPVALDSLWLVKHNSPKYDTMRRVYTRISDPDTLGNYYRYFTAYNSENFIPALGSTYDDRLVNGKTFDFPLDRAMSRGVELDFETYGYCRVGDTIRIKWTSIDKNAYDAWNTLEFAANSAGPLSSGTRFQSNIEGDDFIGIWCSYGVGAINVIPIVAE